ncbi:MAG: hypothetical protein ACREIS_10035 [Nitrospiraceae bacterium]
MSEVGNRRRRDSYRSGRRILLGVVALAMTAALPEIALGEESEQGELPDKFMIRGGSAYIFGTNATLTFPGDVTGIGTSIDFDNTLGGSTSWNSFRVDSLYRFNDSHSVGFSWYRISLAGQTSLDQQIQIEDQIIDAGATTNSSLNLNLYRLLYNYSFYRSEKVELAVSPGLFIANLEFSLAAEGTINGVPLSSTLIKENLTLPLPSIGGIANYRITPRLQAQIRSDFFYVKVGDYVGSMFEFYAGLEYRLFKHVALGAAYDRLAVDVKNEGHGGSRVNLDYNLLYMYGTIYVF